jgi:hypothetical protein
MWNEGKGKVKFNFVTRKERIEYIDEIGNACEGEFDIMTIGVRTNFLTNPFLEKEKRAGAISDIRFAIEQYNQGTEKYIRAILVSHFGCDGVDSEQSYPA